MSPTPKETDDAALAIQTALDLGAISLEQASQTLEAVEKGLIGDPVQGMVSRGFITEEAAARIRDLIGSPESIGDLGNVPFAFQGTARSQASVSADAETSPLPSRSIGSSGQSAPPPAPDEAVFRKLSSRETTAPEPGRKKSAADPADAPVFSHSDAREPTSPEPGRKKPPETAADIAPEDGSTPASGPKEPSTRTGRPPRVIRTPSAHPSSVPRFLENPTGGRPNDGAAEPGAEGLAVEQPGRYTFRYLHASGGQARILLVHDEQIGRDVALKEVSLDEIHAVTDRPASKSSLTSAEMQRLLREARVTGQLEHPNIIPVYDLGKRRDGALYYTMRFVRGVTLSQRLKACRTLSERLRLLKPFLDICNAIAYAHSRGVIHRDLKPANAMVGEFGETVLLDWGIAKVRHRDEIRAVDVSNEAKLLPDSEQGAQTVMGEAIGTPGYMSPEQAKGLVDQIDERSDVFGLGAILYQILTGQPPYKGGSEDELLVRARRGKIAGVLKLSPDAPRPLAAIAEKALAADPGDRYQSAKELADEIDSYMTGGRVSAYAYSSRELLFRFARQHRLLLSSAALLFAVICAALIAVSMSLKRQQAANAALDEARRQEHSERLYANLNLAAMHAMDSGRFSAAHKFASAEKSALLSLRHNPAHPKSAFYSPKELGTFPKARFLRVLAASSLYQARLRNFASIAWTFTGSEAMTAPAFSPDGNRLAVGSYDGKVRLLDTATGALLTALPGHSTRVNSVAFSPDGRFLASAAQEPAILVRDARSGAVLFHLLGHRRAVRSIAFSDDGRLLASGSIDGTVRLWNAAEGREVKTIAIPREEAEVNAVLFSGGGKAVIAGCSDGAILRIPLLDGPEGADGGGPEGIQTIYQRAGEIWSLAKPPTAGSDRILAAGRTEQGVIEITARGTPTLSMEGHDNGISSVAYDPSGSYIASSGYDATIRLWSQLSGTPLLTLEGHTDFVSGAAFAPRAPLMASTGFDRTVRLWHLGERGLPQLLGHTDAIHDISFSPDGRLIASGGWDKTIRLWDAETGAPVRVLKGHVSTVTKVSFSADGTLLLSASRDGTARIWDVRTGAPLKSLINPDGGEVECAAFSPDGTLVATGSSALSGSVYLWDAATGAPVRTFEGHRGLVSGVIFSRDGRRLATSCRDKSVLIFDVATGQVLQRLEGAHSDWLSDLAWGDASEKTLFTAGKDGLVAKWDAATGAVLSRIEGHEQWVNALAISASGRLLATASDDMTVRIWNAATGELLLIINTLKEATAVAFSKDEKTLAAGDGTILSLYPMDFSMLDADPHSELGETEL